MNEQQFCQSCAMPLTGEETLGTNADGSKNADYCTHCYQGGKFTMEMTMEQMIGFCAPYMAEGNPCMTKEQATEQMQQFFPKLKRWASA